MLPDIDLYPMHYTAEERATFVRWHYAHGCIVKQTANHFRISRDTVSRWLAVRRGQRPNYSNATRTAPARKITAKDVRYIKRAAKTQLPEVIAYRLNRIRAKEGRAPVCKKTVVRVITGTRQPMKLLGPLKVKVVSPVNMKRRVLVWSYAYPAMCCSLACQCPTTGAWRAAETGHVVCMLACHIEAGRGGNETLQVV